MFDFVGDAVQRLGRSPESFFTGGIFGDNRNNLEVIADKDFALQEDHYAYQKGLQQQIFDREDNAVQRRVADLKEAGLSPVLAAGSAANAGAVVKTDRPDMQMKMEAEMQKMAMLGQGANIMHTVADVKRIEATTEAQNLENKVFAERYKREVEEFEKIIAKYDADINYAIEHKNYTEAQRLYQELENEARKIELEKILLDPMLFATDVYNPNSGSVVTGLFDRAFRSYMQVMDGIIRLFKE